MLAVGAAASRADALSVTEYPLPPGLTEAYGVSATAGDGAAWISLRSGETESGDLAPPGTPSVGRIDPATGAIRVVSLPEDRDFVYAMTRGPDGAIWAITKSDVVRIDPVTLRPLVVHSFAQTPGVYRLSGITTSGGRIWVRTVQQRLPGEPLRTNPGTYAAMRSRDPSTGAWTVSVQPSTDANGSFNSILAAPDGRIWFDGALASAPGANPTAAASFTPATGSFHTYAQFPIFSVTVISPDGSLWGQHIFTRTPDPAGPPRPAAIDRVNPNTGAVTGSIQLPRIADTTNYFHAATVAADGTIWGASISSIMRINPRTLTATPIPLPTAWRPNVFGTAAEPAIDRNGNLWVVESGRGVVARISPNGRGTDVAETDSEIRHGLNVAVRCTSCTATASATTVMGGGHGKRSVPRSRHVVGTGRLTSVAGGIRPLKLAISRRGRTLLRHRRSNHVVITVRIRPRHHRPGARHHALIVRRTKR